MIVILDTETTGLSKPGQPPLLAPGICQIGIVKLDADLKEVGVYSSLINPEIAGGAWDKGAIETHGIKPEDVTGAPTFFEAFHEIAGFMVGGKVWSGWNISYDIRVVRSQLERYGFESNFPWPPAQLDMMLIAQKHMEMKGKKGMKFPKLTEAYQSIVGKELEGAHDATADVRAVADVMRRIGQPHVGPLL